MATIGTLAVNIVARTEKFRRGLMKAQSLASRFAGGLKTVGLAAGTMGLAVAGAGAAVGTFLIKQQLSAVDALAKTSDKLGITTERLTGLHLAAEETGVSTKTFDMALQRMVRRVAEAAQGTGEAVNALDELGISAASLHQLSPDRQFEQIASAMSRVGNQGDRVRLAMKLFDSEGVSLVNTLKLGKEGLDDVQRFAEKAGLTFSREMAAGIERANKAWGRFKAVITGVARQFAVRIAPLLEHISNKMTDMLVSDDRVKSFADSIMRGVGLVITGVIGTMHKLKVAFLEIKALFADLTVQFTSSPLVKAMGLGISGSQTGKLQAMHALAVMDTRVAMREDPAADFLEWFETHLAKAMKQSSVPKQLKERFGAGPLGIDLLSITQGIEATLKATTAMGIAKVAQAENRILEKGTREAAQATRRHGQKDQQRLIADNTRQANRHLAEIAAAVKKPNQTPPVAGLNG